MACGQASKARFPKGFAVMGCAGRAIVVSQRRSCKPKPSRQPSTWSASVRCCNARSLDSRPDPSVLCLRLHVCDCARRHDVRTKFPSRVFHTPVYYYNETFWGILKGSFFLEVKRYVYIV